MDKVEVDQHVLRALIELQVILDDPSVDRDIKKGIRSVKQDIGELLPEVLRKFSVDKKRWIE